MTRRRTRTIPEYDPERPWARAELQRAVLDLARLELEAALQADEDTCRAWATEVRLDAPWFVEVLQQWHRDARRDRPRFTLQEATLPAIGGGGRLTVKAHSPGAILDWFVPHVESPMQQLPAARRAQLDALRREWWDATGAVARIGANPLTQSLEDFLAVARRHYAARTEALTALGIPSFPRKRRHALRQHARWAVEHRVNRVSYAALASRRGTAASEAAIRSAIRDFVRLVGLPS